MMNRTGPGRMPHESSLDRALDGALFDVPYHVLGYEWRDDGPALTLLPLAIDGSELVPDGGHFEIRPVKWKEAKFRISRSRHCTGRFEGEEHIPCPLSEEVTQFSQCPSCMSYDIPDPDCIFEPHCNTGSCGASFCRKEHVVYITSFRGHHKVGMTQLDRYLTRGREQGADMILPLFILNDRYSARFMEKEVSKTLKLPQSVRSGVKLRSWSGPLRMTEQRNALERLKERVVSRWEDINSGLPPSVNVGQGPEGTDIPPAELEYPLEEPLSAPPMRYRKTVLRGEVLGFKGSYMIFRSGGLRAFRIGELPGSVLYFRDRLKS